MRKQVVRSAKNFLKAYAASLGIDLESADIETLAAELSLKLKRVHTQRSRISLRQAERRQIVKDIDALEHLHPAL